MIVVVSDLHLSEGRRDETQKLSPQEDFFFDDEFARFLSYVDLASPEPAHLIINGDLFDFLQVSISAQEIAGCSHLKDLSEKERAYLCTYGAKTDENSTILKLDKIARGHTAWFRAVGAFLAAGNKLTVVIGNHDIELSWLGVQRRFVELLAVEEVTPVAADGGYGQADVSFAPWVFYDRDYRLFAEHGNQYESLNSFRYFLYPVLPKKKTEINLPVGSFFVRYLLNQIERINPFADNIKPNTQYIAWAFKENPWAFRRQLRLLSRFIVTLAKTYRRSGRLSRYDAAALIEARTETDERLRETARKYDIQGDLDGPDHALRRVMALGTLPINDSKGRFAWNALLSYADVWFFLLAALAIAVTIIVVPVFGLSNIVSSVAVGFSVLGLAAGTLLSSTGAAMTEDTLRAVRSINDIFNSTGNPVRYITFGHSHEPDIVRLDSESAYFNTGTWGVIFNEQEELIRQKEQFAFLMIEHPGAEPRLMRWNDPLGQPELLPLFEST